MYCMYQQSSRTTRDVTDSSSANSGPLSASTATAAALMAATAPLQAPATTDAAGTPGSFFPGWSIPPPDSSANNERLWTNSGSHSNAGGGGEGSIGEGRVLLGRSRAGTDSDINGSTHSFGLGSVSRAGAGAGGGVGGGGGLGGLTSIVDVIVVHGSDVVPEGYSKITRSSGGKRADLNSGAMGQYLYLAVSAVGGWGVGE